MRFRVVATAFRNGTALGRELSGPPQAPNRSTLLVSWCAAAWKSLDCELSSPCTGANRNTINTTTKRYGKQGSTLVVVDVEKSKKRNPKEKKKRSEKEKARPIHVLVKVGGRALVRNRRRTGRP